MDLRVARGLWDPEPGWLDTASYGLPPRPAWEELQAALDVWRHGRTNWHGWDESTHRARRAFAHLVHAQADDVAVGSTVSGLLSVVAAALPAGARVVVPEIEFTSNLFPWLVHEDRGVTVAPVPPDALADAVDERTTLVAFSLVQSATGRIAPYDEVIAAARAHGALVCVDATQACGWLPFDATRVDVFVCAAYKWLMAPRGVAFCYIHPDVRDRLRPLQAGWYAGEHVHESYYGPPLRLAASARRFDVSPAWFCFVGAAPALELLGQVGVEAVGEHNVALANRFRAGLGLEPGASAIVNVDVPGAQERLRAAGVRASVRAGRVRASFHLYTTERDVDLALEALSGRSP
ncbi:MAG: aminotransferase class V-fold PLP-dependent enzyme [Streptosporangiales bacterium]|nr:aminotransferase class V-fold PLP-dependent enzyme [Streptosporangiales bacterium]